MSRCPARKGCRCDLLRQVEPFPTQEVVPYDTAFLSGHVVEHYKVVLLDAAKQSQRSDARGTRVAVWAAGAWRYLSQPADSSRLFSGQTFKHVLVPVWMLSYNYGARAFQVIVNGYTGKIAGKYPYSVWKILLLVLVALFVLGLFLTVASES